MKWLTIISLLSLSFFVKTVLASSETVVRVDVKTSVCGNHIAEPGESCDGPDLNSRSCADLGYLSGSLDCGISCSYATDTCLAPSLSGSSVASADVSSLLAAGLLSLPSIGDYLSTPSLTVEEPITVNISDGSTIRMSENTVITRSDGDYFNPLALVAGSVDHSSVTGLPVSGVVKSALQWGIASQTLVFSEPVTISFSVGQSLNGTTLQLYRSASLISDWVSEGIVSPANCVVVNGLCQFRATKASFFAAIDKTVVSSTTSSTSTTTTTATAQTVTPTPTINTNKTVSKHSLPDFLLFYDSNNSSRIELTELYNLLQSFVDSWRDSLEHSFTPRECDINHDAVCDLKDLSVILFYVER